MALVVVAVVLLPLAGGFGSIRSGWRPVGDVATILIRSLDSWSLHPPLVGMPSTLSSFAGSNVAHAGPLQFWVAALPVKLFGVPGYGLIVATAVVAALSLVVALAVSARHGGRVTLLAVPGALVFQWVRLGPSMGVEPLNPFAAVMPFVAFALCCWAVARRDEWFWVPLVGFGSYAAQLHLTYTVAVAVLGAATLVWCGGRWWVAHRAGEDAAAVPSSPTTATTARRARLVALGAGIACWAGPIVDQFWGSGNLGKLLSSEGSIDVHRSVGDGLRRLAGAVTLSPDWTRPYVAVPPSLTVGEAVAVAVFVALFAAGAIVAWRRRDTAVVALVALTVGISVAGVVVEMQLPKVIAENGLFAATPFLGWYAIGPLLWAAQVIVTWRLLAPLLRSGGAPVDGLRTVATVLAVVGMVVVLGTQTTSVAAPRQSVLAGQWMGEVEYFAQRLAPIDGGDGILVTRCDSGAEDVKGVVAMGLAMGKPMRVDATVAQTSDRDLAATGEETTHLVICPAGEADLGDAYEKLATYVPGETLGRYPIPEVSLISDPRTVELWVRTTPVP